MMRYREAPPAKMKVPEGGHQVALTHSGVALIYARGKGFITEHAEGQCERSILARNLIDSQNTIISFKLKMANLM
jgi:hypothetical protein